MKKLKRETLGFKLKILKKILFFHTKHLAKVRSRCLANLINIMLEIGTKPNKEDFRLVHKALASYDQTSMKLEKHLKTTCKLVGTQDIFCK